MTLSVAVRTQLSASFALDVSFTVQPGITIVFGASGSGKTTLLRSVAGLLRPDTGRIAVGERVFFDSERRQDLPVQHRRVGYVFQELALFPHMSAGDNIAYGLRGLAPGERRGRTEAIAHAFRISQLLGRRPDAISGGERQRAALARSLVTGPDVLLLDEPLSGLDHATASHIIADLRAWNAAKQIPILYVTHAHREVFALGERVLALDHGRVVADGTPHEVVESPGQEPLAQLAGFENFFDGSVIANRADSGTMLCRLEGSGTEIEAPLSSARPGSPVRLAIRAGDILVANQEPRGLSARNVLPGAIVALHREGPRIVGEIEAGERFVVHLTPGACEGLRLDVGVRVWLIIKTHSFRIVAP
jgi:molybdate transport system ATP-binding protein